MPSSITLTVSHLPTSTSFFLSALQPLNYVFRGRTGQTIGFGSSADPSAPADFWITQEVPGVPAGAAHVAFNAPSRAAVQDFFVAALKAGGKIHGEPCVRDSSGYYSGAVIDFDGNSIEAVHRSTFSDDKENDTKSMVSQTKSATKAPSSVARSTVSSRAPSETRSVAASAPPPPPQAQSGDIIDNLLAEARHAADAAREMVGQARSQNQGTQNHGSDSSAVVGTLLGVAAGAALHYAFTNNHNNNSSGHDGRPSASGRSVTEPPPRSEVNYSPRAIEAPPSSYTPRMITMQDNEADSEYASTIRPSNSRGESGGSLIASSFGNTSGSTTSKASRKTGTRLIEGPPSSYKAPTALTSASSKKEDSRSRASTSSRSRRSSSHGSEKTIVRVTETFMSAARIALPASAPPSRTPSTSSRRSSRTVLRDRAPEEIPLPISRASTWAGDSLSGKGRKGSSKSGGSSTAPSQSIIGKTKETKKLDLPSGELTPDDSISQVSIGTGRSRKSRR